MAEENKQKSFILKKVIPGEVMIFVSPMSNPTALRKITLTDRVKQQVLPLDWALGFIMDQGNYALYKKGYVTFDDNDGLAKAAVEAGVWFDTFDFTPAEDDRENKILTILKTGIRTKIREAIDKYGKDFVRDVASAHIDELTTAVVGILENLLGVQLVID